MVWGNASQLVEARNEATPFARLSGVDQAHLMYVLPFHEFMAMEGVPRGVAASPESKTKTMCMSH